MVNYDCNVSDVNCDIRLSLIGYITKKKIHSIYISGNSLFFFTSSFKSMNHLVILVLRFEHNLHVFVILTPMVFCVGNNIKL